jgi:hypothetical protein
MTEEQKEHANEGIVTEVAATVNEVPGEIAAPAAKVVAPVIEKKRPVPTPKKKSPQAERAAQIVKDKRKKHHRSMHKQAKG